MRFRDGTQDAVVIAQVLVENEYHLPKRFEPTDIIIDVGANIGAFAVACLRRSCGKVICYEPEPDNFSFLKENSQPYRDRVEHYRQALWRSDVSEPVGLYRARAECTAMHLVGPGGEPVDTIGLDEILERHEDVRLLKLDCEGAEYPGLYTSKLLRRCREIIGEAHHMHRPPGEDFGHPPSIEGITAFLQAKHYEVWNEKSGDDTFHFFARRKD